MKSEIGTSTYKYLLTRNLILIQRQSYYPLSALKVTIYHLQPVHKVIKSASVPTYTTPADFPNISSRRDEIR